MDTSKNLRLAIGINSLANAQYPAYTNHVNWFYRLGKNFPNADICFINPSRCSIDRFRNMAAAAALEFGADYLLFIDDDVVVPLESLQKLIDMDADIAAGHVLIRGYPYKPMVFRYVNGELSQGLECLDDLSKEETDIINVDAIGTSYALIKTSLLKKMPKPYFVTTQNSTEDIYFCLRARQVYPECTIKVDRTIECGHILGFELITPRTKDAYARYFVDTNPDMALDFKESADRGNEYYKLVEGITDGPQ